RRRGGPGRRARSPGPALRRAGGPAGRSRRARARYLRRSRRRPRDDHGRRGGGPALGGGGRARRRRHPLFRGRRGRRAAGRARDALPPRADADDDLLVIAGDARARLLAHRGRQGGRRGAGEPSAAARAPGRGRRSHAPAPGAQGLRDAVSPGSGRTRATMRAVVFHGPEDLRDEVLPVPEPAAGEIVLRIDAALTCGTDVKVRRRGHPVMIPRVPTVFGHEFSGTVTAVGAGVSRVREGDRVAAANSAPCGECRPCLAQRPNLCEDLLFVNGAYGEYIALPPRLVAKNIVRLQRLTAARAAISARSPMGAVPTSRSTRQDVPRCGSRRWPPWVAEAAWYSLVVARPEQRCRWILGGRITRN